MNHPEILVVGSLAFDVMFSVPHDFRQSIPLHNGTIEHFNATYIADRKKEYPGGTAGNIAAWLSTQGLKSSVFSAWGQDLKTKGYADTLEAAGHELKGSVGEFTAHCYNVSDPLHQQLVIWQPNHYEKNATQALSDYYSPEELKAYKWAIFAAGTPDSIAKHMSEFRAHNSEAFVIFDPGQVSPFFTDDQFKTCVNQADLVIGNQVEAEHFEKYMHHFWPEKVIQVTTLGAQGINYRLSRGENFQRLPAENVGKVIETTGAGDAFRAGLISGLAHGKTLTEALILGGQLGAQSVGLPHPQPQNI